MKAETNFKCNLYCCNNTVNSTNFKIQFKLLKSETKNNDYYLSKLNI